MIWVTIGIFIISYLLSKKEGASDGEAALIGAGAAAAAYYTIEPTNPDAIWGANTRELFGMAPTAADAIVTSGEASSTGLGFDMGIVKDLGTTAVKEGAGVLKDWGPLGTAGVIGAAGLVSAGIPTWMWVAGAGVLALILVSN